MDENREVCEQLIQEKMMEIVDIMHQYNPKGNYLAMAYVVDKDGGNIMANNTYYDVSSPDSARPICFHKTIGGK